MRFAFNGADYRIVWKHDRSRRWSDHLGHNIAFSGEYELTDIETRNRYALVEGPTVRRGRIMLLCSDCKLIIGNVPKALRKRKTKCLIQKLVDMPDGSYGGTWQTVLVGTGTPNEKAGDRFNREAGRACSLLSALEAGKDSDFAIAALACYAKRKLKGISA